jgi:predicted MPP superfamily phosphohydrolase
VVTQDGHQGNSSSVIKVAAAGVIHAGGPGDERFAAVFADAAREADLILLAGDLTLHGEPGEAGALVEAVLGVEVPVVAVLGNHDWHANRSEELLSVLRDGGLRMLERESTVLDVDGTKSASRA